jgi:UDP-N-acetylmuramyl pentapeptide synthase
MDLMLAELGGSTEWKAVDKSYFGDTLILQVNKSEFDFCAWGNLAGSIIDRRGRTISPTQPSDSLWSFYRPIQTHCEDVFVSVVPEREHIPVTVKLIGEHNMRPVVMACAVAKLFQVDRDHILAGVEAIRPVHGRMSPAKGLHNSIILDDSASTSKTSLKYGLQALYSIDAPDRILVTDDVRKLAKVDYDLISEVLILGGEPTKNDNKKIKFFAEDIDLINHLGQRLDENCLVLLEIPIPEIIESYLW